MFVTKTCDNCNVKFSGKRRKSKTNKYFCSMRCLQSYRKSGIPINKCQHCDKETANPKFCSRSCAASVTGSTHPKRKKVMKQCEKCKEVMSGRNKICGNCKNKQEELFLNTKLKDLFTKKAIKNKHPSWKSVYIRHHARIVGKELIKLPCAHCGYSKHVEICHIKPITSFPLDATIKDINNINNLIQLCPNCHWEMDNIK